MEDNQRNNNYISLQEASKLCSYSQEYLSLRARQGKLRATKFGRNWVTTKEWLSEYISRAEIYKGKINSKWAVKKSPVVQMKRELPLPPENLPIEKPQHLRLDIESVRPVLVTFLVTALLMAGSIFGKESLMSMYDDVAPIAKGLYSDLKEGMAVVDKKIDDKLAALDNQLSFYIEIANEVGVAAMERITSYYQNLK